MSCQKDFRDSDLLYFIFYLPTVLRKGSICFSVVSIIDLYFTDQIESSINRSGK